MIKLKQIQIQDDEILSQLKKDLKLKEVGIRVLQQRIIDQIAQEKGITVTESEIQAEADRRRYENRLYRASDTFAWLSDQLITAEEWETGIRDALITEKLSQHLFSNPDIEKFFAENQLDFDQVLLYRIVVPYEKLAKEISYAIQEEEISFYEAAHLYDVDPKRQKTCGYEGLFYRWNLKPDISALVFSSDPGKILGPVTIDQASHLLMVEEFVPAELTPERYKEIQNRMFNEWLSTELNYQLNA
jgi:parvulin-like peptidyl-prolyl isomerase